MGKHKQKTHASTGAMWFTASGKYCGWIPAAGADGCSAVNDDKETASLSQLVACCVCNVYSTHTFYWLICYHYWLSTWPSSSALVL